MKVAAFALCCLTAFGQSPPKRDVVIALANAPTADALKDMSTALEVAAGIRDWSYDEGHSSFNLNGRASLLGGAEWVLHIMDKPGGWRPSMQEASNLSSHSYHNTGDYPSDKWREHLRVYYLTNPANEVSLQEMLTTAISVGNVVTAKCGGPSMMIFSGSEAEINLGEWIIRKLDVPAGAEAYAHQKVNPDTGVFKLADTADGKEDILRVFYLDPATVTRPRVAGDLASKIRTSTNNLHCFWRSSPPAIVVRGSSELVAAAQQIIEAR